MQKHVWTYQNELKWYLLWRKYYCVCYDYSLSLFNIGVHSFVVIVNNSYYFTAMLNVLVYKLTWFVVWLRSVSGLSLVPQRCRWCWFWWRFHWTLRGTFRTTPWHTGCRQVKVGPPRGLVIRSSSCWACVKLCSPSRILVKVSTVVISSTLVVVRPSTGVKVVICSAGVVTPSGGFGGAALFSGATAALWGAAGCVARCAVCFYEFNLKQ